LEALLLRFDQANNLDAEDLAELIAAAEDQAIEQRLGGVDCGQLMSAAPLTCRPDEPLAAIAERFRANPVKSLPVVDEHGRLQGLLERSALFETLWDQAATAQPAEAARPAPQAKPSPADPADAPRRPWHWFKPKPPDHADRIARNAADARKAPQAAAAEAIQHQTLSQHAHLLRAPELSVDAHTPVGQLLATLARHQVPCVPVLEHGVLVGVITRTDLMRLLLQPVTKS
jgi:CBS domain-containing membrane protein